MEVIPRNQIEFLCFSLFLDFGGLVGLVAIFILCWYDITVTNVTRYSGTDCLDAIVLCYYVLSFCFYHNSNVYLLYVSYPLILSNECVHFSLLFLSPKSFLTNTLEALQNP